MKTNRVILLVLIFKVQSSYCQPDIRQLFNDADKLILENKYNAAFNIYKSLENIDTIKHISFTGQGFCLFKLGDTLNSFDLFKRGIERKKNYLEGLYQFGYAYQISNKIVQAKKNYIKILKIIETHPEEIKKQKFLNLHAVYNNLGVIYFEDQNKIDSALSCYNFAIKLDSSYFDAIKNRGKAYFYKSRLREAESDLEHALSLDTSSEFCKYFLFYTYTNLLKYQEADKMIKLGAELTNENDYRAAGLNYYLSNEFNKSLNYYLKIPTKKLEVNDQIAIAWLMYNLELPEYCNYFNMVIYKDLKKSQETLKTNFKKYRILKKLCK